jgi:hypothetical protein
MDQSSSNPSDLLGCVPGTVGVGLVRDVIARIERAMEAVADGDYLFAGNILDDLVIDLLRLLEPAERTA